MSISTLASTFDHENLAAFRYWYERQPFTAYDPGMGQGPEEILSIEDVLEATDNQQMALVSGIATTRTQDVDLRIVVGQDSQSNPTLGYAPGLRSNDEQWDDGMRAPNNIAVSWFNNTGATLTTAQQLTFLGAVKTLTTADKILLGLHTTLTEEDQHYITKFNIHAQGLRPLSLAETLERVFRRSIVQEVTRTYNVTVGTTPQYFGPFEPPASDEILVVRSVAADVQSADVGNYIQWTWVRDNQRKHFTFLLDNHPGLNYPWPIWMSAKQKFGFNIKAVTAPAHSVPIRIRYWRVKFTTVIQALFGVLAPTTKQEQHIVDQVKAGVIA